METPYDLNEFLKGKKCVVVYYSASWCKPCREMKAGFIAFQKEFNQSVTTLELDIDECEEIVEFNGISSIPTFHVYKNGELEHEVFKVSKLHEIIEHV